MARSETSPPFLMADAPHGAIQAKPKSGMRTRGELCKPASMSSPAGQHPVYVEQGNRRVFACSLEWPGWCRSGRDEERALLALAQAGERFRPIALEAGFEFPGAAGKSLDVVERVPGSATTDFGAPGAFASGDLAPVLAKEAEAGVAILAASWAALDLTVSTAPEELRKGPRGGGRDRDEVLDHVVEAEVAYARKIGIRHRTPDSSDLVARETLRRDILAVLGAPSGGGPPTERGWPPRYATRRFAWHVLDHLWEIEDRSDPVG